MAKILFTWELGLGFGHLSVYLDLIRELQKANHEIFFAARDVGNSERILGPHGVTILQAPFQIRPAADPLRKQYSYADFLYNIGFHDPVELAGRIKVWRHLYEQVRPDALIMDHSPTAQLAYLSSPAVKILSGTGFTVPPAEVPMPNMCTWETVTGEQLAQSEQRILDIANAAAGAVKLPPLSNLAELFRADGTMLLTFRETDHYEQRNGADYLGIPLQADFGEAPEWPAVDSKKRIFAYLHPFKSLPSLLKIIAGSNLSAIVFAPDVKTHIKEQNRSERIIYADKPLRIMDVMNQCDVVMTNATHATTVTALLAGKPVLMMPDNLERLLGARRVVQMGAGLAAPQMKPEGMASKLRLLLMRDEYAANAQKFAQAHADFNPQQQLQRMLEIIQGRL